MIGVGGKVGSIPFSLLEITSGNCYGSQID